MKNIDKKLVVRSNDFISASFDLTSYEYKIIQYCLALDKWERGSIGISDQVDYSMTVDQFARTFGIDLSVNTNLYSSLKKAVNSLYEKSIFVKSIDPKSGNEKKLSYRIIQAKEYVDKTGYLSIKFSNNILPFLNNLNENFTKYKFDDVRKLGGFYSMRIFELMSQYKRANKRFISLDELRDIFCLVDKYKNNSTLIQKVVEPSINEINEKNSFPEKVLVYTKVMDGKKLSGIELSLEAKVYIENAWDDLPEMEQKALVLHAMKTYKMNKDSALITAQHKYNQVIFEQKQAQEDLAKRQQELTEMQKIISTNILKVFRANEIIE